MVNTLKINTAQMGKVIVELETEGGKWKEERKQQFGSQVLLKMIEEILKKGGIRMKNLNQIKAATGPGSFTGLRVGVSVANALGFSLGIPVNGKETETELTY